MHLLVGGVSYRAAPLALRERLAVPPRDLPAALTALRAGFGIDEAVLLSTCNRVELYVTSPNPSETRHALMDFLSHQGRVNPEALQPFLSFALDGEAARHLFRVTAGLDSMVLGESEIAAQVKQAYLAAHAQGATGPVLNRLFQKALHSAKVIRSRTGIAEGQASIGSVVVRVVRDVFGGDVQDCEVLLWGAGKAAETTARHLIKDGVRKLWIVNRTETKAQDLAMLCQGGWLSWERALGHLAHVDIAIVCTQAPHYVVDADDVAAVMPGRPSRPLCFIDLAVPRNVDPAIARQAGVHLYNVDDLQSLAQATLARRHQELERCGALIREQTGYFLRWHHPASHQEVVPCRLVAA